MDATYPTRLPPTNYRRIIEEISAVITDPALKLKFIKQAIHEHGRLPAAYRSYTPLAETAFRKRLLDQAEKLKPGSQKNARHLAEIGIISTPRPALWRLYRLRHLIVGIVLLFFVCGISSAVASLWGTVNVFFSLMPPADPGWKRGIVRKSIIDSTPPLIAAGKGPSSVVVSKRFVHKEPTAVAETPVAPFLTQPIWLVEKTRSTELYSNRLLIFTRYTVPSVPRDYHQFLRNRKQTPAAGKRSGRIAGILYHVSESDLVPFKPELNMSIKKKSEGLIRYLQRRKSYNYIIDRFGRVYRLVQDDHAAFHAGNAIWADDGEFYLNLNHAFIGICFEGRDFEMNSFQGYVDSWNPQKDKPRMRPTGLSSFTEAQLRSGKELTDWLRVTYRISQHNCVPHALVSVNPKKKLIGWHLDLACGFPFEKFSLSNKYQEPLPSIVDFGFSHDAYFEKIFGGDIWPGIRVSESILRQRSARDHISLDRYRKRLQTRYDRCSDERSVVKKSGRSAQTARK
jgi:hypothetical protein